MASDLENKLQKEILQQANKFEQIEFEKGGVAKALTDYVEVHDPDQTLNRMGGTSLHNAERKEPIRVSVGVRDILSGSGTMIAGVAITNPYMSGAVLLIFIVTILLRNKYEITPYQALTYGVGWELVGDKNTIVDKEYLIDEVVEASKNIDVVEDMTREMVESTLGDLKKMRCINIQEGDEESLVWFREEFDTNILPGSLSE